MKKRNIIFTIIILFIAAVLLVGTFIMLNKKNESKIEEVPEVNVEKVQQMVLQDLSKNYPPTPREVMKLYSEITCCFYNSELTEEDLTALGQKARELYDEELIANQTQEEYLAALKEEILAFNSQKITISGYSVSSFADVDYYNQDGYEWAKVYVTYRLRQGTEYRYSNEVFLLRKDADNHWKIYGWTLAEEEKTKTGADGKTETGAEGKTETGIEG